MPAPRDFLMAGGAALGAWLGLELLRKRQAGHFATEAETTVGVPAGAFLDAHGGPVNYTDTYIAMKAHALVTFDTAAFFAGDVAAIAGQLLDANHQRVPRATRAYRTACLAYYAGEVNRLCGLSTSAHPSGAGEPVSATADHDGPGRIPTALGQSIGGAIVNVDSADAILKAWRSYGAPCRRTLATDTDVDILAYWDLLGRLAIALNVDRAVPVYDGQVWAYVLEAGAELPAHVRDAVVYIVKGGVGFLGSIIFGVIPAPVFVAAGIGALILFRAPIAAALRG